MGIVYGDLKCANVFVEGDGTVKLADLFSSVVFNGSLIGTSGQQRSEEDVLLGSVAKEVFEGDNTRKSDIYAFGCLLMEMLNGGSFFWNVHYSKQFKMF